MLRDIPYGEVRCYQEIADAIGDANASRAVGMDGLPSGIALDEDRIKKEMARRAASGKALATPRKEGDKVEIVSGYFKGYTTGTPLTGIIKNENTKSGDYTPEILRPGHADFTAYKRYGGFQDYRGGGHFSGRLTAPMVFAGAVCKEVLRQLAPEVSLGSRIVSIGTVADVAELPMDAYASLAFEDEAFPLYHQNLYPAMKKEITDAMACGDSVGGVVEGYVTGMPAGIGDPIFDTVESRLSSLLFAVPAVKGVAFGTGFDMAAGRGSQMNDPFTLEGERVVTGNGWSPPPITTAALTGASPMACPLSFGRPLSPHPPFPWPRTVWM